VILALRGYHLDGTRGVDGPRAAGDGPGDEPSEPTGP
jgi:hypothetical protein